MSTLRIATFNVKPIPRYGFNDSVRARADDGFSINDLAFTVYDEESKRITARAIRETNADVICLRGGEWPAAGFVDTPLS